MKESKKVSSVEKRAAAELLQEPEEITIGGEVYSVAPASNATIIKLSSFMAAITDNAPGSTGEEQVLAYVMSRGRDCAFIGDFLAVLVLGAKKYREIEEKRLESAGKGRIRRFVDGVLNRSREDGIERLKRQVLEEMTPRETLNLTTRLLGRLQLGDFFGLITFLQNMNVLRPTKVIGTTVSGQS